VTWGDRVRRRFSPARFTRRLVKVVCTVGVVQQGPFAGMRYFKGSSFISYRPVLLGTYERELWPWLGEALKECDGAVVVGAAEGYYAVGLGHARQGLRVVAFEAEEEGRRLMRLNTGLNPEVQSLEVRGRCDCAGLEHALAAFARPLLLMDVEGREAELIVGLASGCFRLARIIVEIHDFVDGSIAGRIRGHLNGTHTAHEVWQEARRATDLPDSLPLRRMLWRWYAPLITENRPGRMRWLYFEPKGK